MRKIALLTLMGLVLGVFTALAVQQETKVKVGPGKGARWSGTVVRVDKQGGFLDVRKTGATMEKRIYFNDATKWTKGKEAIQIDDVKEQDKVVCLGTYEGDKFTATRINLRMQK